MRRGKGRERTQCYFLNGKLSPFHGSECHHKYAIAYLHILGPKQRRCGELNFVHLIYLHNEQL